MKATKTMFRIDIITIAVEATVAMLPFFWKSGSDSSCKPLSTILAIIDRNVALSGTRLQSEQSTCTLLTDKSTNIYNGTITNESNQNNVQDRHHYKSSRGDDGNVTYLHARCEMFQCLLNIQHIHISFPWKWSHKGVGAPRHNYYGYIWVHTYLKYRAIQISRTP